jgi:hypothetical protein
MEIKDVTSWLGIEADSIESFKEAFEKKYFTEDQVFDNKELLSKFTGKTLGNITRQLSNIGRAQGIEFQKPEIEGKPIEDVVNLFLNKQADQFNGKIKELETHAGSGSDEKLQEWVKKYEKLEGKYRDTESALKKTAEDFEGFKQTASEQVKSVKLDFVKEQLWSTANFAPGTDPLKLKGFRASFNESYKIDLDETGAPYIADVSGKRIQNPNKHSEFLGPQDVLNLEIEKHGLSVKNQRAGQPAFRTVEPVQARPQNPDQPLRKINPRAQV